MKCNIGAVDKIIRVIVGISLLYFGYKGDVWWLYVLAIGPLVTACIGYCPPYTWMGISTNKKK